MQGNALIDGFRGLSNRLPSFPRFFVATALISYFVIERRFSAIGRRRPRHPTLLTRLEDARGRPTGFDYLRLTLAVGVIFWHSFVVSYGMLWVHGAMGGLAKPFVSIVLPSFFALSGFLVMASFDRSNIIVFAGLRILRIGPALAVETIVSAVVIGALFTNEPLRAYFTDKSTLKYSLNMIGRIQYFLPGMFDANPIPKIVNAQLWTIPRELDCYLILFGFGLLAFIRKTSLLVLAGYALSVLAITYSILSHPEARVLNELGQVTGRALILCFLAGCVLYTLRESVPHSLTLFAIATIAFVLLLYSRAGESLLGLPAAYMTAFLGLTNFRKVRLIAASDYSYGIYLYGFAIQQCVARFGQVFRHWYVEFPLSLTIVTIVAAVSWHFVEKPALSLRRYLSRPGFGLPALMPAIGTRAVPQQAGET